VRIYDDIVDRRGRPARDELPLLAPPPQRDDVAGAVRGGELRVAGAAGGAGWDAGADATGEWIVSARGAHTSRRRENDTPPVLRGVFIRGPHRDREATRPACLRNFPSLNRPWLGEVIFRLAIASAKVAS
jgi:hypothetical protein